MDFYELDNKMVELGYISRSDFRYGAIVYKMEIVYSEITDELGNTRAYNTDIFEAGKEEISEATIVKIIEIEKF